MASYYRKTEISASLMDHLACIQTLLLPIGTCFGGLAEVIVCDWKSDVLNTLFCSVTYVTTSETLWLYWYSHVDNCQHILSQMVSFHRHTFLYVLPTHLLLGPEHFWNLLHSGCAWTLLHWCGNCFLHFFPSVPLLPHPS